jgi:rod shape-determining protein MreC
MQSLLLLLLRYGYVILFLVLETLCFYLIIQNNEYQRSVFVHSSNRFSGSVLEKVANWQAYLDLQLVNDSLLSENAQLKKDILHLKNSLQDMNELVPMTDTSLTVIGARVINNSIHLQNNYMTLNRGIRHGVESRMGVLSDKGVVGVVEHVSDNFSTVLPFLNSRSRIRGKIVRNDAIGSVSWDGKNADELVLEGIPKHLSVQLGDTVITSGYSTIFPEGQLIGLVSEVTLPRGSNTFMIRLKTPVSMGQLRYVYIIKNYNQAEQLDLESQNQ